MSTMYCPDCAPKKAGAPPKSAKARTVRCIKCHQHFSTGEFYAHGEEAMASHEKIVISYNRNQLIKYLFGHGTAIVFTIVAACLIVFAPEHRGLAANIVAGALIVVSAGISGFTHIKMKAPGAFVDAKTQR